MTISVTGDLDGKNFSARTYTVLIRVACKRNGLSVMHLARTLGLSYRSAYTTFKWWRIGTCMPSYNKHLKLCRLAGFQKSVAAILYLKCYVWKIEKESPEEVCNAIGYACRVPPRKRHYRWWERHEALRKQYNTLLNEIQPTKPELGNDPNALRSEARRALSNNRRRKDAAEEMESNLQDGR